MRSPPSASPPLKYRRACAMHPTSTIPGCCAKHVITYRRVDRRERFSRQMAGAFRRRCRLQQAFRAYRQLLRAAFRLAASTSSKRAVMYRDESRREPASVAHGGGEHCPAGLRLALRTAFPGLMEPGCYAHIAGQCGRTPEPSGIAGAARHEKRLIGLHGI